jgi:hypothetical protein
MGIQISGVAKVVTMLRNVAQKVPDHARRTMHNGADEIVERAKLFCPRDTGALEDSIHKEVGYGARRRLEIDVVAGQGLDYAEMIHENYEGLPNTPGKNTVEKMAENPGVLIGSKFLTRAADEQAPKLERMMIEAVTEVVEEESR